MYIGKYERQASQGFPTEAVWRLHSRYHIVGYIFFFVFHEMARLPSGRLTCWPWKSPAFSCFTNLPTPICQVELLIYWRLTCWLPDVRAKSPVSTKLSWCLCHTKLWRIKQGFWFSPSYLIIYIYTHNNPYLLMVIPLETDVLWSPENRCSPNRDVTEKRMRKLKFCWLYISGSLAGLTPIDVTNVTDMLYIYTYV